MGKKETKINYSIYNSDQYFIVLFQIQIYYFQLKDNILFLLRNLLKQ